jgi:hypothetical protein
MLFAKYYALPLPVVLLVSVVAVVVFALIANVKRKK